MDIAQCPQCGGALKMIAPIEDPAVIAKILAHLGFTDERDGVEVIHLPPSSPNLDAYARRFVRSIKEEALNRIIVFGEASLRRAILEYLAHYHAERNHRGCENRLIKPSNVITLTNRAVQRRDRLGGMLRYYYQEAA